MKIQALICPLVLRAWSLRSLGKCAEGKLVSRIVAVFRTVLDIKQIEGDGG